MQSAVILEQKGIILTWKAASQNANVKRVMFFLWYEIQLCQHVLHLLAAASEQLRLLLCVNNVINLI